MQQLLDLLAQLNIPYQKFDHPAVFTCEETGKLGIDLPGARTKQLLMKGKRKEKLLLAIVMHNKKVDTHALAKECNDQSMSFASPELLKELLGVTPGSVTPFGLIFDRDHRIEVMVDEDAWKIGQLCFHPLVNTATLVINREGFEKFLKHTGHGFTVRRIPQKTEAVIVDRA